MVFDRNAAKNFVRIAENMGFMFLEEIASTTRAGMHRRVYLGKQDNAPKISIRLRINSWMLHTLSILDDSVMHADPELRVFAVIFTLNSLLRCAGEHRQRHHGRSREPYRSGAVLVYR